MTTKTMVSENNTKQQQDNNESGGEEQQQQQPASQPKVELKVKGLKIDDLKEFLARKKLERAARCKEVVKMSGSHSLTGRNDLGRAQSRRLGGISDLTDRQGCTEGAAKGGK